MNFEGKMDLYILFILKISKSMFDLIDQWHCESKLRHKCRRYSKSKLKGGHLIS